MFISALVIALGVFAVWVALRGVAPDWIWARVSLVLVLALSVGDYCAPHSAQVVLAAAGLVGLLNQMNHRLETFVVERGRRPGR